MRVGLESLQTKFCIEKGPVDSSAGVLQNSANAELTRL